MDQDLKTGDIILFNGEEKGIFSVLSWFVKFFTHSNYSHIGIILKDPKFSEDLEKGLYVWESGYEEGGKLGVQTIPLEEVLKRYENSKITIRKIKSNSCFTDEKLKEVYDKSFDKPYDIDMFDWISALFRLDFSPKKTDRFWCSAFVGYIYTQVGILTPETDWSILRPCDFSLAGENLEYSGENKLDLSEIRIK